MGKLTEKSESILKKTLVYLILTTAAFAMTATSALAACNGEPENYQKRLVTYLNFSYLAGSSFDSSCHYYLQNGQRICQVRFRGILYSPLGSTTEAPTAKYPALLINHGSEHTFEANKKFCTLANYFVPKGYIVFVPFRRGHGDDDGGLLDSSTGVYVEDMLDDWASNNPTYPHFTNCNNRSCYKAQLLKQQADEEVSIAMTYLKGLPNVKKDPDDPELYRIGIMGISYGGAVTVYANRKNLGQKAAVPFSPGAQQWGQAICAPFDQSCGTDFQRDLITAAANAKKPAFYLQAKWDYDTRATIDLAYAHAYGSSDPKHSRGFNAAIYPYKNPCPDHPCTADDYQSIHAGFFGDPDVWGTAVLDFLKRMEVK